MVDSIVPVYSSDMLKQCGGVTTNLCKQAIEHRKIYETDFLSSISRGSNLSSQIHAEWRLEKFAHRVI
jgi:hypothetical protein